MLQLQLQMTRTFGMKLHLIRYQRLQSPRRRFGEQKPWSLAADVVKSSL
jgi:hypothetical protein